jgi:colanic acid biosynthesis glycosyl transferase WcaI
VKILLHGINFAPELTGVGKYTGEMAEWLAARGHEVRVVTAPPYYPEWKIGDGYRSRCYTVERWWGAHIWRCPLWVPDKPGGLRRLVHLASFVTTSFPVMLRHALWRPDVVWVVEPALFCAPSAWLVARLCGAKAWLHIQDYELDAAFELGLLKGGVIRWAVAAWENWLMRRFERVSTISEKMLDRARTKGVAKERLMLVPNWVDAKRLVCSQDSGVYRDGLGIATDAIIVLYSGTMGTKQGLELIGRAAQQLSGNTSLVFVLCGNGPERANLERQCEGLVNVRFLDLQPLEHFGKLLATADIHLLPQQSNAADLVMPSKLAGMLASGRPVVATCAEGTEIECVVQGRGLVVPPGDAEALARAVTQLAADEELRIRLGAAARAYAEEHLAFDTIMARFEQALEDLVGQA